MLTCLSKSVLPITSFKVLNPSLARISLTSFAINENRFEVSFDHVAKGLEFKGSQLKGFSVKGSTILINNETVPITVLYDVINQINNGELEIIEIEVE